MKNYHSDFMISERKLRKDHRERAVFFIGLVTIIGIAVLLIP